MASFYYGSLHNHTDYSNFRLRDSINTYERLIDYAIELKHEVIAFTEHEAISNAIKIEEYYNKVKKTHPDFKVILGNEIYLCRNGLSAENFEKGKDKFYHFILLAKDAIGHEQIRRLSSRAWKRSFKQGKMIRVPTYYTDLEEIIGSNPGHVIGSTACLGGFLPSKLLQYGLTDEIYHQMINNWCCSMQNIFGKEDFYLEMQPSHNEEQVIVNQLLLRLSNELNIPYLITNDAHYLKKSVAPIHKAFLNSQDGDREVDDFYATTYLMDTEELESYFDYFSREEIDAAYETIKSIKNKCSDFSLFKDLKIPSLKWNIPEDRGIKQTYIDAMPTITKFITSDFDGDRYLAQIIANKLDSDFRLQNQRTYDEIENNLQATWQSSEVNKAHWSAYFLNLQKIIEVCWNAGTLVGPGRGSGVGFILLYLLDIIQINPLWETTKCYSWRFLNPERVSVLDIDTDIEGGRRAEVLQALRDYYGEDRVANVVTFGTEKSKSALQTAARGLEIDNDISAYLSSLIPSDRGQTRTLRQCFYGDEEKDMKPIPQFVYEMTYNYPELWEVAQSIEGLICRVGEHAGGVIFVDEDFENSTALMRVPNGDIVTQFDLHDCEKASLIKIDLLSVECLDKIHNCIDLLCDYGYAQKKETLKDTYDSIINIYSLKREDKAMWQMIWNHQIQSLFQMEKQSGAQGIALIHPTNLNDLAVLNSVMRLMASEKGGEQPLNMWARYRSNINQWIEEMRRYGLTEDEIDWLSHHDAITDGMCESQEGLMLLVQEPRLGGNSLTFADKCRKGIAKKQGKVFQECEETFFKNIAEQGLSDRLAHYVWDVLLKVQRGYSFNRSHCLAYSLIALQEMNMCYDYPLILWNCACLMTDTGGEGSGSNYDKIAAGIGKMINAGIKITLPDINNSDYGFKPDIENNQIYCGLKNLTNVGDDIVKATIENRPYVSPKDYLNRIKPNKQAMISLIKGGAFDEMMDRKLCMGWYLWETCDKKSNLTLQNMSTLIKYNMLPLDTEERVEAYKVYNFNRFLKDCCKFPGFSTVYILNTRAVDFLSKIDKLEMVEQQGEYFVLDMKKWDKVYQKYMDVFRNWIGANKAEILTELNKKIFSEEWIKYTGKKSISAWEMESLCFYYHEHELANVNTGKYGIVDYAKLPEEPITDKEWQKGGKTIKLHKLYKICGTCIAKNKNKSTVTLLTTSGVVEVKFRKEYFSLFDKRISAPGEDGKKKIIEYSWFDRGSMIMVQGTRIGDNFVAKKYAYSGGHQLYKIESVDENGDLLLRTTRAQGDEEESDD